MRITLCLLTFCSLLIGVLFWIPSTVEAKNIRISNCAGVGENSKVQSIDIPDGNIFPNQDLKFVVHFNPDKVDTSKYYRLLLSDNKGVLPTDSRSNEVLYKFTPGQWDYEFNLKTSTITGAFAAGTYVLKLRDVPSGIDYDPRKETPVCDLTSLFVGNENLADTACSIEMPTKINSDQSYEVKLNGTNSSKITFTFGIYQDRLLSQVPKGITKGNPLSEGGANSSSKIIIPPTGPNAVGKLPTTLTFTPGTGNQNFLGKKLAPGKYFAALQANNDTESFYCAVLPVEIGNTLTTGEIKKSTPIAAPGTPGNPTGTDSTTFVTCNSGEVNCIRGGGIVCKNNGVLTAIGCVPTNPVDFVNGLMAFTAGAGGGIALLLMVSGSFQMITSQGSPDQLKKGREQFIAAATGLLFIIFSVTLLRIIGVDILQIPGFQ